MMNSPQFFGYIFLLIYLQTKQKYSPRHIKTFLKKEKWKTYKILPTGKNVRWKQHNKTPREHGARAFHGVSGKAARA